MSADLLGLDDFYKQSSQPNRARTRLNDNQKELTTKTENEDDDDFGEFESVVHPTFDAPSHPQHFSPSESGISKNSAFSTARIAPVNNSPDTAIFGDFSGPEKQPSDPSTQQSNRIRKPRDENVLFDAEDESDDDDFGDFEAASAEQTPDQTQQQGIEQDKSRLTGLLIDFDDEPTNGPTSSTFIKSNESSSRSTASFQEEKQVLPVSNSRRPREVKKQPAKAEPEPEWEDFQVTTPQHVPTVSDDPAPDWPASTSERTDIASTNKEDSISSPRLNLTPVLSLTTASETDTPPSNIPPPAVILPVFSPILGQVQEKLHKPLAALTMQERAPVLSQPFVLSYLASVVDVGTVLGHIISGRKLRWKRDVRLAQSMRIGPASSSGKSGGMKLTGVDKAESSREDREVGDVLRSWKAYVGKLRSVISISGSKSVVPELTDTPLIRTAQESEGAISSTKACVLCGMKRNERAMKIDVDIQDSFGEWWIEHWGHRSCQAFWNSYESDLRSK